MPNWSNPYPGWGDTGASPPSGKDYGVEQVNEKHFDYLWDNLNKTFDEVLEHTLQDDGSVTLDDGATAITFADDGGADETLFDMAVSATPTAGDEQSVVGQIDATNFIEFYAEADGSGSIQNSEIRLHVPGDLNGNDLVDGGTTIWDAVGGHIEQTALENDSISLTGGNAIDAIGSISLGGSATVAVATDGIQTDELDLTITPTWTGSHTFNSGASVSGLTVDSATFDADWYDRSESGTVVAGNAGNVFVTELADGETLSVTQAALTNADGTAVATDTDLIVADLTNSVSETTLVAGDGATVFDDETGSPLGSYTNSSGAAEQVAILVDNGHFNAGSGSDQDIVASFIARVT